MTAILFQSCFIFLTIYAAVSDYQRLKIPNCISLTLCGLFLLYALRLESWADVGSHIVRSYGVLNPNFDATPEEEGVPFPQRGIPFAGHFLLYEMYIRAAAFQPVGPGG